ncbi:MAG: LysM peptidoglycan-binding domain-containing protein, partial [Thermoplasmata archaeon]
VSELAAANDLGTNESIEGVEALVVPVAPAAAPSRTVLYTARRGDTLITIADRFGVSLEQLRRWNQITGTKVAPGWRLHVAEPVHVVRASAHSRRPATARPKAGAEEADPPPGSSQKPAAHAAASKGKAAAAKSHRTRKHAAAAKSASQ